MLHKNILKDIASLDTMDMYRARILVMNYIFYTKGIEMHEVMSAPIKDVAIFERMITVACNYFLNLP